MGGAQIYALISRIDKEKKKNLEVDDKTKSRSEKKKRKKRKKKKKTGNCEMFHALSRQISVESLQLHMPIFFERGTLVSLLFRSELRQVLGKEVKVFV